MRYPQIVPARFLSRPNRDPARPSAYKAPKRSPDEAKALSGDLPLQLL